MCVCVCVCIDKPTSKQDLCVQMHHISQRFIPGIHMLKTWRPQGLRPCCVCLARGAEEWIPSTDTSLACVRPCSDRQQSQDGKAFVHAACEGGHMEVVRYLYDVGGKEQLLMSNHVSELIYEFA